MSYTPSKIHLAEVAWHQCEVALFFASLNMEVLSAGGRLSWLQSLDANQFLLKQFGYAPYEVVNGWVSGWQRYLEIVLRV